MKTTEEILKQIEDIIKKNIKIENKLRQVIQLLNENN